MGHVHLVARDLEASRRFFTALGGAAVQNGTLQMIQFPGVFILVRQAEPTGGTVGSVVNHFGFNVKDIKSAIAKWRAAGLMVETTARADQAWLMTPDGARVVTGGGDRTVRVWDAKSGAELLTLKGHTGIVWSAAFSPDGARVLTASHDLTARVWDAAPVPNRNGAVAARQRNR